MKHDKRSKNIALIAAVLILFFIFASSAASATTKQGTSSAGTHAYISNSISNTVSVINLSTNKITATVPVGNYPLRIAVTPDGKKAYVINWDSDNVSVIDTVTNKVIATVKVGKAPIGVAVNPDGSRVYVTNHYSSDVSVIDTTTNKVTATIPVENSPRGVAVTPNGKKVYITNSVMNVFSAIDSATNTVTAVVPTGNYYPYGIAITPDGKKAYVTNAECDVVSVIDTSIDKVRARVKVGSFPTEVVVNPTGTRVYVVNEGNNTVSVIDTSTNKVTTNVSVGSGPCGITVTPDGKKVYVTNWYSKNISVIDTATNKVTDTLNAGSYPGGIAISSAPRKVIPIANFTSNVTSGYAPLTVSFTDKSTGSPTSWRWVFEDGKNTTVKTSQNTIHTYYNAGTYTVKLTVTNDVGSNTTTKTNYITVKIKKPVAAFSAKPTEGKAPLEVTFIDKSTGLPTSWFWNFGDGNTSIAQNPTHKYTKVGKYTVSLTVKNIAGSNTITKSNYINVLEKPVAAFSASPNSGTAPLKVTFTDKSTNNPASWKWTFGDGKSSTDKNPVYTYSKEGKYNVSLTVTNVVGSNTTTKTNYITVKKLKAPKAAFSASPTSGSTPLKVTFTDKSTNDPASWSWNFGDESTSKAQNPTHTYSKIGNYTVRLIVTNPAGGSVATITNYIQVTAVKKPVAIFSASPTSGTAPLKVTFTDKSNNDPTSWSWNFGDKSTSTVQKPTHTYNKAGKYTVSLTVKNAAGSNLTVKYNYIVVTALKPPVPTFSAYPTSGKAPLSVKFTDKSIHNPTSWAWKFGDGSTSTVQNPTHKYIKKGTYTVSFTVKNAAGSNSITKSKYITVK